MAGNEKMTKRKYEDPTAVNLGEVARGSGVYCAAGGSAFPGYCTAGTAAQSACTAGTSALGAACTTGTFPGA